MANRTSANHDTAKQLSWLESYLSSRSWLRQGLYQWIHRITSSVGYMHFKCDERFDMSCTSYWFVWFCVFVVVISCPIGRIVDIPGSLGSAESDALRLVVCERAEDQPNEGCLKRIPITSSSPLLNPRTSWTSRDSITSTDHMLQAWLKPFWYANISCNLNGVVIHISIAGRFRSQRIPFQALRFPTQIFGIESEAPMFDFPIRLLA